MSFDFKSKIPGHQGNYTRKWILYFQCPVFTCSTSCTSSRFWQQYSQNIIQLTDYIFVKKNQCQRGEEKRIHNWQNGEVVVTGSGASSTPEKGLLFTTSNNNNVFFKVILMFTISNDNNVMLFLLFTTSIYNNKQKHRTPYK